MKLPAVVVRSFQDVQRNFDFLRPLVPILRPSAHDLRITLIIPPLITWAGGSVFSNVSASIPHDLGMVPLGGWFFDNRVNAGLSQNPYYRITAFTALTFQYNGETIDGQLPPAGSTSQPSGLILVGR